MSVFISDARLEKLGKARIAEFYPHLKDLNISFLFQEKARKSGDKIIAGKCSKVGDREFFLHGHDIIIEIAQDIYLGSSAEINNAVMDHELAHIGIKKDKDGLDAYDSKTGRIKLFIKKHDLQEFTEIYERHGAYHEDIYNFVNAQNAKPKVLTGSNLRTLAKALTGSTLTQVHDAEATV